MSVKRHGRRIFMRHAAAIALAGASGLLHVSRALAKTVASGLEKISSRVVRRGDVAYPLWWAAMSWYRFKPERYPDAIVQAGSEADVIDAVNYARERGLRVAVRSTGHNPAKAVLREGGILLDLGQLDGVEVDASNGTAWVQPGIRAEQLVRATREHGLVFPAAHTGFVGLGGYLLGGGLGWNMPEYGIACRSILGAEIIMADGSKVYASAEQNEDLHWAVRGAGPGFFGAVVRYKLRLFPVHRAVHVSSYVIPAARIPDALGALEKIGDKAAPRLETLVKIGRFHPADRPYEEREVVLTVSFFAFADNDGEAMELLAPVDETRIAALGTVRAEKHPITYDQLYLSPATDLTSQGRTTVENMWTEHPAEALGALSEKLLAEPPPSPRSFLLCAWSLNSTLKDPTSCVLTGGRHYMSWYMIADREEHIAPNYLWMDEAVALMQPWSEGRYVNEIDPQRYPHHVQECFAEADWERLERLRAKYDPDNVFHHYLGHGSEQRAA